MVRVDRVVVTVGELQQIETDLFEFSLTQVLGASDPRLAHAEFQVVPEPVRFACRVCAHAYGRDTAAHGDEADEAIHFIPELSHAYVRCPECGSPDFEITAGRGVILQRVEGSDGED